MPARGGHAGAAAQPREAAPRRPAQGSADPLDAVTVLMSASGRPINKVAWLDGAGALRKAFAKNDGAFVAQTVPVADPEAMAELLVEVGSDPAATICPGLFAEAPDGPFGVLAEAELLRRLGLDRRDFADQDALDAAINGFHEVDGLPVACRRKINMGWGSWLPFDRDAVRGMPPPLAGLSRAEWFGAMDLLIAGMSTCGHVLVPSSTTRVLRDGKACASSSYHVLVQVADPAEIGRVWPQLLLRAFTVNYPPWDEQAIGFLRPLFSTTPPETIVGHRPWSIFDPCTGSPERLLFEGAPVARGADLSVAPPAPEVRPGARLDLALFADLAEPEVAAFSRTTGDRVHVARAVNGCGRGRICGVSFTSPTVDPDQELVTKRHGTTTIAELVAKGVRHERCQSPWRPESTSWAAFLGRHGDGSPFVYDTGTCTKYVLPGGDFPGLSHDALALDLGAAWGGDARHVHLWGRWMFWSGSTWEPDERLAHVTRTREHLRRLGERAVQLFGEDDGKAAARALRNKPTVAAVADLARSNPDIAAGIAEWDRNPLLCGAPTRTIDLRTGEARAPERADLITKSLAVDPAPAGSPAPPLWTAFLERVTDADAELVAYLRRLAGYCLTGDAGEHVLPFAHGGGANGKGVFFGTIADVMGEYAVTIGTEMLMVSVGERHPTEVARLRGARLALGSEVESNQTWAEAKIKKLTGGDRLQGRFMRCDFFEFDPQFKLVVFGNRKPSLRGVDEAIRRRLHLIPFTVTIPPAERDPKLREKLRAEWPAVLRWMVDGCLEWQRVGLKPPARVVAATEEYLGAEDLIERWREECLVADPTPGAFAPTDLLFKSWTEWCAKAGENAGTKRKFSDQLSEHGLARGEFGKAKTRGFAGVKVKLATSEQLERAAR